MFSELSTSEREFMANQIRRYVRRIIDMKTTLMIVLCSVAILFSGCATSHLGANAWEYRSETTIPNNVAGEVSRLGQEGWHFVSMAAASRGQGENITVVLLFKKHK
jgi:hypothetical protein